jgi:hypothetical protein
MISIAAILLIKRPSARRSRLCGAPCSPKYNEACGRQANRAHVEGLKGLPIVCTLRETEIAVDGAFCSASRSSGAAAHGRGREEDVATRQPETVPLFRSLRRIFAVGATSLASIGALASSHAQAQQKSDDFYRGKQITIVAGSDAGGGYDAYARLVADYLPAHIPGRPTFVVQNMPGAGSLVAMNYVANVAPKDGTVMAAIHADAVIAPLFHAEQARFDAPALNWIGSPITTTYVVAMWRTAPVQKYDQVFEKEAIVAAAGGDSISLPTLTNAPRHQIQDRAGI